MLVKSLYIGLVRVCITAFDETGIQSFVYYAAPLSAVVAGVWLAAEIITATTRLTMHSVSIIASIELCSARLSPK